MREGKIRLQNHTTFRMGGEAVLVTLESKEDVETFFAEERKEKIIPLGGGSNMLVGENIKDVVFVKVSYGETVYRENENSAEVAVLAGRNWDDFVYETTEKGYGTLAPLSLIPGTVGASPVQNIGAYGREIKDAFLSVEAYDMKEKKWVSLSKDECQFAYRKSIFQKRKEFLIVSVTYFLEKGVKEIPSYGGFAHLSLPFTPQELRDEVIRQRDSKLPRIEQEASVGSFFKNPIVSKEVAEKLKKEYSHMPQYEVEEGVKLASGWLIEHSDAFCIKSDNFHLYKNNKLVVVHDGGGDIEKLMTFKEKIGRCIQEKYGITLECEPEIVG